MGEVESQFRGGEAGVFSPNRRLHPTALSRRLARAIGPATGSLSEGVSRGPRGG